ncbi:MAG: cytochrome b/b6 domain-containing protein [Pseudomonadales bacterium]|nr:cytochrome b/b6 domain-containing protein [Pseudomonadales bacterium]
MKETDQDLPLIQHHELRAHKVWDLPVRLFHWLNVLCVLGLIVVGTFILQANNLGVSAEGKVTLKIIHAWIGYVFTFNLLWRLVHAFTGNRYARWSAIVPGGKAYVSRLREYTKGLLLGNAPAYKGHNPLGRIMVTIMYALLITQMTTGLVLAGTDLYFPPFGHEFAEWVTAAGEDHSLLQGLQPGVKEGLNPEAYAAMRRFRAPFIEIHEIVYYLLLGAIFLHIAAVVITEIKEKQGLVSAMLTGEKILDKPSED